MPGSDVTVVPDLLAAQRLVPFPLFVPRHRPLAVTVRRTSRRRWPTVRTTHRYGTVLYAMKQYAMDYFGHFSAPNKLYATTPQAWVPYAPITPLEVRHGSAFHGREWDRIEGGSLVSLGMHVEVRVHKGALGPRGMRAVLDGLSRWDRRDALARAGRPLSYWNWSVSRRRIPTASSNEETAGLVWRPWEGPGLAPATAPRTSAVIEGWRPDSVAYRPGEGRRIARALWRSEDLNAVLEVIRLPPRGSGASSGWPLPPLFELPGAARPPVRGVRSRTLRWAYYEFDTGRETFRVVVPPGRSGVLRDRQLLRELTGLVPGPRIRGHEGV